MRMFTDKQNSLIWDASAILFTMGWGRRKTTC